jgi:tripartite-type tricarboxylate transporter receptor subunit TctC
MILRRLILLCAASLAPVLALAQAYPSKPVRLIVPFPAGGPADIFGRGLAQGMTAELGQTVVVENVGGVGGVLGVDRAVKSAPDGYTLALNSASTLSIAPFSLGKIPYDVRKDFALITTVVRVPEVLAVHPSVPATNFAQFIAYAKANPGKINYGSAGAGSITHLAGELLKADAGLDMVHVPYKGAAPAVVEQFARVSGVAAPSTPEEYAAFLAAEQAKWSKVVQAIGFKE